MQPVAMENVRTELFYKFADHRKILNLPKRDMVFCRQVSLLCCHHCNLASLTNSFDFGFDVGLGHLRKILEHIHDAESIHDSFPTKGVDSNKIDDTTTLQKKAGLDRETLVKLRFCSYWHSFLPCSLLINE